jgi:L-threonylcarbamoyladenylate synthase
MTLVAIADLINAAQLGEVICFPTDTLPALAVKPEFANKIYQTKQRDRSKPLILMASTWPELSVYLDLETGPEAAEIWKEVATKYLPGALTLVLPANILGRSLNFGMDRLGVRIPNHNLAVEILQKAGALLTTSANLSGEEPLVEAKDIDRAFPHVSVLNSTYPESKDGTHSPSTVVTWQNSGWKILRQGAVNFGSYSLSSQ